VRSVAADDRIFDVERAHGGVGQRRRPVAHAAPRQVRRHDAVRRSERDELERHREQVEATLSEGQPARLILLHDHNLDAIDERHAPPAQALHVFAQVGRVIGSLERVARFAESRIAFEDDARAACPVGQPEWPGSDGCAATWSP
jgi:hypothetical protein